MLLPSIGCLIFFLILKDPVDASSPNYVFYVARYGGLTWPMANKDCRSRGMQLASLDSAEKIDALKKHLGTTAPFWFWSSGTDYGSDGSYYWSATGNPVNTSVWVNANTNAVTEAGHCVLLRIDSAGKTWRFSYECANPNYQYVCEGPPTDSTRPTDISPKSEFRYLVVHTLLNWYMARKDCKLRGMELVTIENKAKQEELVALTSEHLTWSFWTSGSDDGSNGTFYWDSTGNTISNNYNNWDANEPSFVREERCVEFVHTHRKWNNNLCSVASKYICQALIPQPIRTKDATTVIYANGGTGEISYVYVVPDFYSTWSEARDDCIRRGLKLVSIQNDEQREVLHKALLEVTLNEWFWSSGRRPVSSKIFTWASNGIAFGYENWLPDYPHHILGDDECVRIEAYSHGWANAPCNLQNRYVCEGFSYL